MFGEIICGTIKLPYDFFSFFVVIEAYHIIRLLQLVDIQERIYKKATIKESINKQIHGGGGEKNKMREGLQVYRYDSVTSTYDRIRVMIITSTISTRSHTDDPTRFRHLIINFTQCRCHFVGKCTSYNHNIRLTW